MALDGFDVKFEHEGKICLIIYLVVKRVKTHRDPGLDRRPDEGGTPVLLHLIPPVRPNVAATKPTK